MDKYGIIKRLAHQIVHQSKILPKCQQVSVSVMYPPATNKKESRRLLMQHHVSWCWSDVLLLSLHIQTRGQTLFDLNEAINQCSSSRSSRMLNNTWGNTHRGAGLIKREYWAPCSCSQNIKYNDTTAVTDNLKSSKGAAEQYVYKLLPWRLNTKCIMRANNEGISFHFYLSVHLFLLKIKSKRQGWIVGPTVSAGLLLAKCQTSN